MLTSSPAQNCMPLPSFVINYGNYSTLFFYEMTGIYRRNKIQKMICCPLPGLNSYQ